MIDRQGMRRFARKAYYDLRLRAAAAGVFACIWWGILYPELCFTDGTYEQVTAGDDGETRVDRPEGRSILDASGDEVVIKSRLLEWLGHRTDK